MTNRHNSDLYNGVTNDLIRRVEEHKGGKPGSFTDRCQLTKLVYFECGQDIQAALAREKQIKAGSRQKKLDLVNGMNPAWMDLSEELVG